MKTKDFDFDLPQALIAQSPLPKRSDSKLLVYQKHLHQIHHQKFKNLLDWLHPGDLLVLNNSKVIPARLKGYKSTGGKVELLIERLLENNFFMAHIKASKALKENSIIYLNDNIPIQIIEKQDSVYLCYCSNDLNDLLETHGEIPLPSYITRHLEESDKIRYQTVYAEKKGSVAVPSAGLHFDNDLLTKLKQKGINIGYLTLHVGAGTFQPVRSESIQNHRMHKECFSISFELAQLVNQTRINGHRVIAVGTTSLRSLESAVIDKKLVAYAGETNIFIYPGYQFQVCDGLITNFHLPQSSLIMLVAAFLDLDTVKLIYKTAVNEKYRFFSYGDACLFLRG